MWVEPPLNRQRCETPEVGVLEPGLAVAGLGALGCAVCVESHPA